MGGKNLCTLAASAVLDKMSGPPKRSGFSEEQILYAIRPADAGTPSPVGVRQGISQVPALMIWTPVSQVRRGLECCR